MTTDAPRTAVLAVVLLLMVVAGCFAQEPAPPSARFDPAHYPWLVEWDGELPPLSPLSQRFPAPTGFARVEVEPASFAAFLRGLPVRLDRDQVVSYRGQPVAAPAAAVVALDLGTGDLQQCADSILRLHGEHLWAGGRAGEARYHFTSGDESSWAAWVAGEVVRVSGPRVVRQPGPRRPSDHRSFRRWLDQLFLYAGTLSIARDSRSVPPDQALAPGDFFVKPGSPGHAVLLLDVAVAADGRSVALVGEGYMPAQDFHVLAGEGQGVLDRVWFTLPRDADEALVVPSWSPFPRSAARRLSGQP